MQRPRALLFFIASVVWLAVPLVVAAQLVPCGDTTGLTPGTEAYREAAIGCDLCGLGQLMKRIINFLIGLSISIAAAMFAYAGFLYVTGASDPPKIAKAHNIFKNVLIGFLIAISAWLVINTILNMVFDKDRFLGSGGDWFTLSCVSDIGKEKGERLDGMNFGDLINEIIPKSTPPPVQVGTSTSTPVLPDPTSEQINREILANAGISVNAPYPQTSLAGMQPATINAILALKTACDPGCEVVVTGGTETTGGHNCTGTYSHCNGYKYDVRPTTKVQSYISGLCGGSRSCTVGNITYTREYPGEIGDHWDVLVR